MRKFIELTKKLFEADVIQGPWGLGGRDDPERKANQGKIPRAKAGLKPKKPDIAPRGWLTDQQVADKYIPMELPIDDEGGLTSAHLGTDTIDGHQYWFELFSENDDDLLGVANEWFDEIGLNIRAVDIDDHGDGFYWKIRKGSAPKKVRMNRLTDKDIAEQFLLKKLHQQWYNMVSNINGGWKTVDKTNKWLEKHNVPIDIISVDTGRDQSGRGAQVYGNSWDLFKLGK